MIPVNATILVVDDVPANIGVLLETLPGAGFEVRVAGNGLEALEQVAYEHPDLILLDIHMPGIDNLADAGSEHGTCSDGWMQLLCLAF